MTDLAALAGAHRVKVFDQLGLDEAVIVATSPAAVVYCSGYRSMGYDTDPRQKMAVVFDRDGWILVGPTADAWAAAEIADGKLRYFGYRTFSFDASEAVSRLLEFHACASFGYAVAEAVRAFAGGTPVVAVEGLDLGSEVSCLASVPPERTEAAFLRARAIKDPTEIALIEAATRKTEGALRQALREARAGVSELDLAAIISAEMIRAGMRPGFIVVTSGPRAALADAHASARRLVAGDLVRFDIGGTLHGYWSDIATTAVVGTPSAEIRAVDTAIVAGQQAALRLVRPGAITADIFGATVEAVRAAGLPGYQRHHVGHGLGLEAHEFPTFGPTSPVPLEPGMVVNVEAPYYRPGWGGLMYEATLLVTETGAKPLSTLRPELISLSA